MQEKPPFFGEPRMDEGAPFAGASQPMTTSGSVGNNAELKGNNGNSASGSNAAVNIKGGNNGVGR